MSNRARALAVLVVAVAVMAGVAAGSASGDDVSPAHEGDHSDGESHDDGNPLPGPGVVAALSVVGVAAAALRKVG